jgi:hypothetical protein
MLTLLLSAICRYPVILAAKRLASLIVRHIYNIRIDLVGHRKSCLSTRPIRDHCEVGKDVFCRSQRQRRVSPEVAQSTEAGRVEDWRGVPKVWPICCSPFPLGVPQ